jgi:hypothetical protein
MILVNIEDVCNEIKNMDNNGMITRSVNHVCEDLRTIQPVIEIPDNATVQDTISALFPNTILFYHIDESMNRKDLVGSIEWWEKQYREVVSNDKERSS